MTGQIDGAPTAKVFREVYTLEVPRNSVGK